MSVARILSPHERRLRDRDRVLSDLIGLTVADAGLTASSEHDIWQLLRRQAEHLLEAADLAVAARVALQAHDERIDRHMQSHRGCALRQHCDIYRALERRRGQLQRDADRRTRALMGGRW